MSLFGFFGPLCSWIQQQSSSNLSHSSLLHEFSNNLAAIKQQSSSNQAAIKQQSSSNQAAINTRTATARRNI
jgi:hypothetical protein